MPVTVCNMTMEIEATEVTITAVFENHAENVMAIASFYRGEQCVGVMTGFAEAGEEILILRSTMKEPFDCCKVFFVDAETMAPLAQAAEI